MNVSFLKSITATLLKTE